MLLDRAMFFVFCFFFSASILAASPVILPEEARRELCATEKLVETDGVKYCPVRLKAQAGLLSCFLTGTWEQVPPEKCYVKISRVVETWTRVEKPEFWVRVNQQPPIPWKKIYRVTERYDPVITATNIVVAAAVTCFVLCSGGHIIASSSGGNSSGSAVTTVGPATGGGTAAAGAGLNRFGPAAGAGLSFR